MHNIDLHLVRGYMRSWINRRRVERCLLLQICTTPRYEPLGYEVFSLSKINHLRGREFPSLGADQNLQGLLLLSEALAKSKANFVGKVGWDLNSQNRGNSNQGHTSNHQKLMNQMQRVFAELCVCAGCVLDTHLQIRMWQVLAEKLYGNQRSEDAILMRIFKRVELRLDIRLVWVFTSV